MYFYVSELHISNDKLQKQYATIRDAQRSGEELIQKLRVFEEQQLVADRSLKDLTHLNKELSSQLKDHSQLQVEVRQLNAELQSAVSSVSELRQTNESLELDLETQQLECEILNETVAKQASSADTAESELKKLTLEIASLRFRLDQEEATTRQLKSNLDQKAQEQEQFTCELDNAASRFARQQIDLDQQKQAVGELRSQLERAGVHSDASTSQTVLSIEQLQRDVRAKQSDLLVLQSSEDRLQTCVRELRMQIARMHDDIKVKALIADVESLRNEIVALNSELRDQKSHFDQQRNEFVREPEIRNRELQLAQRPNDVSFAVKFLLLCPLGFACSNVTYHHHHYCLHWLTHCHNYSRCFTANRHHSRYVTTPITSTGTTGSAVTTSPLSPRSTLSYVLTAITCTAGSTTVTNVPSCHCRHWNDCLR